MNRRATALVVAAALFAACTGDGARHGPSPRPRTYSGGVMRLPRILLRADLGRAPAHWHRVLSVPFGSGSSELGLIPEGPHSAANQGPPSFAVGADGTLWIIDEVKRRVVHFSASGRYLGSVGGLYNDRFHAHARDIAFAGEREYLTEQFGATATDVTVIEGGSLHRSPPESSGNGLIVSYLVPTNGPLTGWVSGHALDGHHGLGEGPHGFANLEGPEPRLLPGMPLPDGTWMSVRNFVARKASTFVVGYRGGGIEAVRPIRIQLVVGGRVIPGIAGPEVQTPVMHGLAVYVRVAPTRGGDAHRYGDSRWFLQISNDGSPLLWERLPDPGLDDIDQHRHLTVGPDGAVYLLLMQRDRVVIFRR